MKEKTDIDLGETKKNLYYRQGGGEIYEVAYKWLIIVTLWRVQRYIYPKISFKTCKCDLSNSW